MNRAKPHSNFRSVFYHAAMYLADNMVDYSNCNIDLVSVHEVGNKTNDEELTTSKEPLDIADDTLRNYLKQYFLTNFKMDEFYSFTFSDGDHTMNPLYQYAQKIFDDKDSFHRNSISCAKHLYEVSSHPNIKAGDFYTVYFSKIIFEGKMTDAIGLFKVDSKDTYLKLLNEKNRYQITYDSGNNLNNMDKGCIIFNIDKNSGNRVLVIEKTSKSDVNYWKDIFLNLKPINDNYQATKTYLSVCKDFVTDHLETEYEITKTDKIDYLNKTVDYFKKNESFNENTFLKEVFDDKGVIESFQTFKREFTNERFIELDSEFDISGAAVKKQARVFKSILKLDKNFHVYIHGDKSLIEKGYDERVAKSYYKIYFDEET